MIIIGRRNVEAVFLDGKSIARIYIDGKLVFELSGACFGKGFWVNLNPWSDDEGWKNDT